MIVYEEWVVEDVTASAFEEPLAANQEVNMSLPSLSTPTIIFFVFTRPRLICLLFMISASDYSRSSTTEKTEKCMEEEKQVKVRFCSKNILTCFGYFPAPST